MPASNFRQEFIFITSRTLFICVFITSKTLFLCAHISIVFLSNY